jgi:hypothetical protein
VGGFPIENSSQKFSPATDSSAVIKIKTRGGDNEEVVLKNERKDALATRQSVIAIVRCYFGIFFLDCSCLDRYKSRWLEYTSDATMAT